MDSTRKQVLLYDHLDGNIQRPCTGAESVHEQGSFSTSGMRKDIEPKQEGWDDPRLPTLMSMRKRGYEPDAIDHSGKKWV